MSTWKKSHASVPDAWARSNCVKVGPDRRGAGLRRCRQARCGHLSPRPRRRASSTHRRSGDSPSASSRARDEGRVRRLSIERVGRDVLGRRVGPVSANELPVPPHQRCGPNEEGGPTLASQESRERRQHDTIGRGEPRSRHLTTEHRELVTKDRDLDVLLIWRRSDPNEVEQLSNEKEGHRTAHADDPGTFAASLVRAAFLRLHPTGWIRMLCSRLSPSTCLSDVASYG